MIRPVPRGGSKGSGEPPFLSKCEKVKGQETVKRQETVKSQETVKRQEAVKRKQMVKRRHSQRGLK